MELEPGILWVARGFVERFAGVRRGAAPVEGRLLGTRRYERQSLWLQLKRNQWKRTWRQWRRSCCRKACCGKSSVFNLSPSGVDESGRMSGSDRESRRASPTRRHDVKAVAATAVEVAEVL